MEIEWKAEIQAREEGSDLNQNDKIASRGDGKKWLILGVHFQILTFVLFLLYPSLVGWDGKESAHNEGDLGSIPGLGSLLEEGMAIHYSTFV